jgi:DNA-3-methyladenine glycosylase I
MRCSWCNLSWECVLNKREAFKKAYDNFDSQKVSTYDAAKITELLNNKQIIRNLRKIFHEIGKTTSPLSDQISADLKTQGMTSVGSTIIYSYLQAVGVIYSHDKTCELYRPQ